VLGHTARSLEGGAAARGGGAARLCRAEPSPAREASAPGWSRTSAPAVSEQCSPLSYGRSFHSRFPGASLTRPYASGTVLGHTARSQEGGQRREAAGKPPVREAREPPAGVEPAPRPYKGRVLPLTLRRPSGDGGSRTHDLLVASETLCHQSFIPMRMQTGGVEPPKPEAPGLQPGELTSAQRPRRRGG
jgi:hypothetical protein